MKIKEISKQDTTVFKAIGILLIVFHNYLHWVAPDTGENEFYFSANVIKNLFQGIINTPLESINLFFDFFGYYGVQIFIFISGVGLTLSMLTKKEKYGTYILHRLKTIYAMLLVVIVFFFFYRLAIDAHLLNNTECRELLWKFLLIHTIIPNQSLSLSGQWWFLGLIFQLYILLPLLLNIIKKFNIKGFIAICLFAYVCTYAVEFLFSLPEGINWYANSIAHLPEFAFGILIALNFQKKIHPIFFIIAVIVFCLGTFSKLFFPLTFLSITLILYFVISRLLVWIKKHQWINKILLNIGTLSMAIFIVHGLFRSKFISIFSDSWYEKLIGAFLFFITIYAVAIVANILYHRIYNLLNKFSKKKNNSCKVQ